MSSGTELSPSLSIFPFSNRLWKERKKGGATAVDSRLTGELVADLDLSGFSDPRFKWACTIYIPRRKSGIYWIQVRRAAAAAAAAVEISLWTR